MDRTHAFLQYQRLERHYRESLVSKDPISFLDLSHCLRIWVDMKHEVDNLAESKGVQLRLTNTATPKSVKKLLKGTKYVFLPLGYGVSSPNVEFKGLRKTNRALSSDELKIIREAGLPTSRTAALTFSEWLGSGIYEVPSEDPVHPQLRISREMLIKRVANILGASHPAGTEEADEQENKFDPPILELHSIIIAGGYPATYYQLLEIAGEILASANVLFDEAPNKACSGRRGVRSLFEWIQRLFSFRA